MLQSQSQSSLPFEPLGEQLGERQAHSAAAAIALPRLTLPAEPSAWDEMRRPDGQLRPAWQRFAELLPPPAAGLTLAVEVGREREPGGRRRQEFGEALPGRAQLAVGAAHLVPRRRFGRQRQAGQQDGGGGLSLVDPFVQGPERQRRLALGLQHDGFEGRTVGSDRRRTVSAAGPA